MPSKSKAQARLMAAAAHNPEIAKDSGIPQSVAKDFNKADKKEGTLKKSSKKPEHKKTNESSMRSWIDVVDDAEIAKDIDDAEEQEAIAKRSQPVQLEEMPQRFDAFQGQDPDEFVDKTVEMTGKNNLEPFKQHQNFDVFKSKNGSGFVALDKQGNQIAIVTGYFSSNEVLGVNNVFVEESIASKTTHKGVVYEIFMDIISTGSAILSDSLHSDSAIAFWTRLLSSHEVYVVGGGEVIARATPEKVHKYWNEDENSPSADLKLLLVK